MKVYQTLIFAIILTVGFSLRVHNQFAENVIETAKNHTKEVISNLTSNITLPSIKDIPAILPKTINTSEPVLPKN